MALPGIADGGYANFRLKINTGNAAAGSQR